MVEHTVHVDAFGAAWADDDALADLYDALAAREEILGPAVSADLMRRSIGLTVTVPVLTESEARRIAVQVLGEELVALGFADAWVPPQPRRAVVV